MEETQTLHNPPPPREQPLSRWHRIRNYIRHHRKELLLALMVGLSASTMIYTLLLQRIYYDRPGRTSKLAGSQELTKPSPLTGVRVPTQLADRAVTGIMIENLTDARPQSSVNQAGVVFEAVAEGGITRYSALYQETRPGVIGPVRSLRPYYLDWVMGFDAAIAHVGGSGDALAKVKERNAKDLDQFTFGEAGFWRSGDREAPHNVYTSFDKLDAISAEKGYTKSSFTPYRRHKKDQPTSPPTNTSISLDFSGPLYQVEWRYDQPNNRYLRFSAGEADVDRESKQQLAFKNVVVIPMPTSYDGKYAVMNTIGQGEALVFLNGTVIKGTWSKDSPSGQLKLLNPDGTDIKLNKGSTWFAIVPADRTISY